MLLCSAGGTNSTKHGRLSVVCIGCSDSCLLRNRLNIRVRSNVLNTLSKLYVHSTFYRPRYLNRGVISNLPFVVAPPTAVSIFLSVYLRQQESMDFHQGGLAVIISGILLLGLGYRPLGRLFKRLIPHCIQA